MAQGTANGIDAISAPTDQQPDASTPSSKNAASPNAIPQTPSKSQPRFRTFFRSLRFLAPVVAALMVIISCIAISVTTIVRIQQAIEALGSILQTSIGDFSTNILNATATNQYRSAEFLRNESFVTSVCFRSSPINLAAPDTYKSILQALDQEIRINPNLGVVGCYTRNQVFSLQRTYDNPNIVSASILEVGGVYTHYAYNRQTYVIDNATILATNPDYVPENRSFWKTLVANGGKPVSLDFGITARQRLGMYT
ncbi:hypothetical protein HK102_001688 [Quaeritorhiza haematococci]|nr:hypothetical protein HK102_001688 [Quaeritorhiza haematococci]